jgi:hypothetical protein
MKTAETTNWSAMLSTRKSQKTLYNFAVGKASVSETTKAFAFSKCAGEFRQLVRTHGATYSRRLARKALRYRGLSV